MKKVTISLMMLLTLSTSLDAQWRKIADFIGTDGDLFTGSELITCIYFLDLPGPPRIGFVGTESELHKTTDGGKTWHSVWDSGWSFSSYYITDICFKDSLTGWFTTSYRYCCYRTTDGGETWTALNVPGGFPDYANAIHYDTSTNRLLLGSYTMRISTDLGNTWADSLPFFAQSYSFSSALDGIAPAEFYSDSTWGYIITTDGGVTWDTIHPQSIAGVEPLAISGTLTCFTDDGGQTNTIRRSDDFGRTWRQIANLTGDSLQYFTGIIRGDLSRLYIQSDSGMYVSTDEGVTWNFDGGPTYFPLDINDRFYAAKGVTIAGMTYANGAINGGGLWEEDWPQSGVSEQPSVIDSATASPNPVSTETVISFGISKEAYVKIEVFDILGNRVSSAGFESLFEPGNKAVPISLQGLPSGTYFARIVTTYGEVQTVKLVKQ